MSLRHPRRGDWSWGAVLAAVLWLTGFEVMPTAHVAFHGALGAHHHGVDREHVENEPTGDRHHDHNHDHDHHHDGDEDHDSPSDHGKGSIAHFDLAANVPLPSIPEVQEALLTWSPPPSRAHDERPADRQPQTTRARAPPGQTA